MREKGSPQSTPFLCASSPRQPREQAWPAPGSCSLPMPLQVPVVHSGLLSMCLSKCWDTVSFFFPLLSQQLDLHLTFCVIPMCWREKIQWRRRRTQEQRDGRSNFDYSQYRVVVCAQGLLNIGIICYPAIDSSHNVCWVKGRFSVLVTHCAQR